jgi:hypothetical protein
MNKGTIFIVHHIDTEGPLWENISELFTRLKLIFDIDIEPSYENLKKLQNGEIIVDPKIINELNLAIDPHTINFKRNWHEIEAMLYHIMSNEFRDQMKDSFGYGWIYNWHIMDHVGFIENPRHRDMGYLNIFDFYSDIIQLTKSYQDTVNWHFHPISFNKKAHIPATSFDNSMYELHQIICRRLIERNWFPIVNRAGFHTERVDANFFLEQWMPFDPSNISVDNDMLPQNQKDLSIGRYGDWRGAPTDWSIYNPCIYDWRKKGNCNRVIARVLNLKSRHRSINYAEIEKAFIKASNGENVYLGIVNHDWRDMSIEIDEFRKLLSDVILKYPDISYKFSRTIEAFRAVIGYSNEECVRSAIDFSVGITNNVLNVSITNGEFFGPQPYLAIKTKDGQYFHDNFDFHEFKKSFTYVFDNYTIPLNMIDIICIASNDKFGNSTIKRIGF